MGTRDRKGGRYIVGTILALVGLFAAGYIGRTVGEESWLETTGHVMTVLAALTLAVQAFTDKNYPYTRGATLARVVLFMGIALSMFGARK